MGQESSLTSSAIVSVVSLENINEVDDVLQKLSDLPVFESSSSKSSSFSFFPAQKDDKSGRINQDAFIKILNTFQSHMKNCHSQIVIEQQNIMQKMSELDKLVVDNLENIFKKKNLSLKSSQDSFDSINQIQNNLEKTHYLIFDAFELIGQIENILSTKNLKIEMAGYNLIDALRRNRSQKHHKNETIARANLFENEEIKLPSISSKFTPGKLTPGLSSVSLSLEVASLKSTDDKMLMNCNFTPENKP